MIFLKTPDRHTEAYNRMEVEVQTPGGRYTALTSTRGSGVYPPGMQLISNSADVGGGGVIFDKINPQSLSLLLANNTNGGTRTKTMTDNQSIYLNADSNYCIQLGSLHCVYEDTGDWLIGGKIGIIAEWAEGGELASSRLSQSIPLTGVKQVVSYTDIPHQSLYIVPTDANPLRVSVPLGKGGCGFTGWQGGHNALSAHFDISKVFGVPTAFKLDSGVVTMPITTVDSSLHTFDFVFRTDSVKAKQDLVSLLYAQASVDIVIENNYLVLKSDAKVLQIPIRPNTTYITTIIQDGNKFSVSVNGRQYSITFPLATLILDSISLSSAQSPFRGLIKYFRVFNTTLKDGSSHQYHKVPHLFSASTIGQYGCIINLEPLTLSGGASTSISNYAYTDATVAKGYAVVGYVVGAGCDWENNKEIVLPHSLTPITCTYGELMIYDSSNGYYDFKPPISVEIGEIESANLTSDRTLQPLKVMIIEDSYPAIGGRPTITLERAPDREGKAVFDIKKIISTYLGDNLHVGYKFVEMNADNYHAYNAVRQLTQPSIFDTASKFLTHQKSYKVYDGYPFSVSIYEPRPTRVLLNGDEIHGRVHHTIDCDISSLGDSSTLLMCNGCSLVLNKERVNENSSFYIRWVNSIGGYEHVMLQRRVFTEQQISDIINIQTSGSNERNTQRTASVNALNIVTVGDAGLSIADFRWLQGVALSPKIEWYNKDTSSWVCVVLADNHTTLSDTSSRLNTIEYIFQLPRILTQFQL